MGALQGWAGSGDREHPSAHSGKLLLADAFLLFLLSQHVPKTFSTLLREVTRLSMAWTMLMTLRKPGTPSLCLVRG